MLKARGRAIAIAIAECNVSPRTVARRSPEVVSVIPGVGAPGAWVTVRGAGFTAEGDVRQPGWKAVRVVSSGDIRVSVPAHGPQTVNLRVVTASGLSPVTRKDRYTITSPATAAASVLSSVSPRASPPRAAAPGHSHRQWLHRRQEGRLRHGNGHQPQRGLHQRTARSPRRFSCRQQLHPCAPSAELTQDLFPR